MQRAVAVFDLVLDVLSDVYPPLLVQRVLRDRLENDRIDHAESSDRHERGVEHVGVADDCEVVDSAELSVPNRWAIIESSVRFGTPGSAASIE
jgi:hypothetical protein